MRKKRWEMKDRSLKRRPPTRNAATPHFIFCEGELTEPSYIENLARHANNRAIKLRVWPENDPLAAVDRAIKAKSKLLAEGESDFDVWVVFDHDGRAEIFREAVRLAEEAEVKVAASVPCFEYWLVLHFQDHHAVMSTTQMRRYLRACCQSYASRKKTIPFKDIARGVGQAIGRASAKRGRDQRQHHFWSNPVTQMDLLATVIVG